MGYLVIYFEIITIDDWFWIYFDWFLYDRFKLIVSLRIGDILYIFIIIFWSFFMKNVDFLSFLIKIEDFLSILFPRILRMILKWFILIDYYIRGIILTYIDRYGTFWKKIYIVIMKKWSFFVLYIRNFVYNKWYMRFLYKVLAERVGAFWFCLYTVKQDISLIY